LDFNINPKLEEFAGQVKPDIDFIKEIEMSIAAVFVLLDIACIDENTHQKLVNMCLKDKRCSNHVYLQNLIESKLKEMLKNDILRFF
jgi:hypothetical protein